MTARSGQHRTPAIIGGCKTPKTTENLEVEKSDEESSTESEDLDDNGCADEHSNSSRSLHIQRLEAAVHEAFRDDLDLAAFFLSNLGDILGLHNSRDLSRQKVCSWIQLSPHSNESSSRKTQSSCASQGTSDSAGQNRKRPRSANPNYPERRRERDDEEDDPQERDPKKYKEGEHGLADGDPLLACPFWKKDPAKYNKHYLSDTNTRMNKYGRCEGPGFTTMHRLKYVKPLFLLRVCPTNPSREHLERKHTHAQCERCGAVFDGSDEPTRAKRLQDHLRLAVPCELSDTIVQEGISTTQWATIRKQVDKKGKGNSRPIGKSTVEKWNEIWVVLFPDVLVPSNPCKLTSLIHCPPLTREGHHRENPHNPSLLFGDPSPLGNFRRLFEISLNQKAQTEQMPINELTISLIVDLAAQILHFTLSQGVQDLTLGTSSGQPHSSDYGSLLGGSYLDVTPSSAGTAIRDPNLNHLSHLSTTIQRAPQADMAPGLHANSSPVINVDQMYVQGIDRNRMPSMNTSSGTMNQFESLHAGTSMARTISGQYVPTTFGSTPSFENPFGLDEESNYAMAGNPFYNNGLHSYGNGNQNNENQALYQPGARVQPSTANQFRNPSEFGHPPHDSRH
jgi:hypothetical protein